MADCFDFGSVKNSIAGSVHLLAHSSFLCFFFFRSLHLARAISARVFPCRKNSPEIQGGEEIDAKKKKQTKIDATSIPRSLTDIYRASFRNHANPIYSRWRRDLRARPHNKRLVATLSNEKLRIQRNERRTMVGERWSFCYRCR